MQINLNTINFILLCLILTGCSKAKIQESESTPPKIDNITQAPTTTTPTQSQTLKNTKTSYNGTYEATMNNPSIGKTQPLHLKLQEDKIIFSYLLTFLKTHINDLPNLLKVTKSMKRENGIKKFQILILFLIFLFIFFLISF